MDKMREDFEAAFYKFAGYKTGDYCVIRDGYDDEHADWAWWSWVASRQDVEVELPESATVENEWDDYEIGYNNGIESTADAIRAAGIRIKGDL